MGLQSQVTVCSAGFRECASLRLMSFKHFIFSKSSHVNRSQWLLGGGIIVASSFRGIEINQVGNNGMNAE